MTRARKIVAATTLSAAVALALPAAASAQEPGLRTGPVQFWATGNDRCEVTFDTVNTTNGSYVVDFVVDDENPATLAGTPGVWSFAGTVVNVTLDGVATSRTVGRRGVATNAEAPLFQSGVTGYVTNRTPVASTATINLRDLAELPNPESHTHTVTYQVVLGPNSRDKGWDPVAKQFARFTTEVTGCTTETTTTLTGPATVPTGTAGTFDVVVAPTDATGTVQFTSNGQPIGDPVPAVDGRASLTHVFDAEGTFTVAAQFTGGTGFQDSVSNEVPVVVGIDFGGSSGSSGSVWGF